LSRNTKFEVNFGKKKTGDEVKPFNQPPEGLEDYTQVKESVLWIRNYFFYPDPAPTFLRLLDPDPA
jgi:hypothetical protein